MRIENYEFWIMDSELSEFSELETNAVKFRCTTLDDLLRLIRFAVDAGHSLGMQPKTQD